MKPGRKIGLILLAVGVVFGAVNVVMILSAGKYFPKLTAAVPVLALLGIAMMLFPGKAEEKEAVDRISILWNGASVKDKSAWIVSSIAGLVIGLYIILAFLE